MPARRATSDEHELVIPSRRRAIKAAAATGTAALVWTEPTIKGLVRRPAYAAAGSSGEVFTTTNVTAGSPANAIASDVTGLSFVVTNESDGGFGSITRLSAVKDMHSCKITGSAALFYTITSGPETLSNGTLDVTDGSIVWNPGLTAPDFLAVISGSELTGCCDPG